MRNFILSLAIAVAVSSPALALDFSKPVMDESGRVMCMERPDDAGKCADPATVGKLVRNALYTRFPDEQSAEAEQLYKRAAIAQQILDKGNEYKPGVDDLGTMKKTVGKKFAPLIIFQVWNELDPPKT